MRHRASFAIPSVLIALSFVTLAIGAAPPQGAPTCVRTPFHGITTTSETGEIIGAPDPLDWGCADEKGGRGGRSADASGINSSPPLPPPSELCLLPAAPNPTTAYTRLRLLVPVSTHVSLVVYGEHRGHGPSDVFPIRTLIDAQLAVGEHAVLWDGKDDAGASVSPGIYRAVMVAGTDVLCGDIEIR